MSEVLREVALNNGLLLRFTDLSRHYYGGYFQARVEATCTIDLQPGFFADKAMYEHAISTLGQTVLYRKDLGQMGVREEDLVETRNVLIETFLASARSYLDSAAFPVGVARKELETRLKASQRGKGPASR